MSKRQMRSQILREELKERFTNTSGNESINSPEQSKFQLPFLIRPELMSVYSETELRERIAYSKERSDFYSKMFNDPKSCKAEKDFFQKCCEYHVTKLLVWETVLERLKK